MRERGDREHARRRPRAAPIEVAPQQSRDTDTTPGAFRTDVREWLRTTGRRPRTERCRRSVNDADVRAAAVRGRPISVAGLVGGCVDSEKLRDPGGARPDRRRARRPRAARRARRARQPAPSNSGGCQRGELKARPSKPMRSGRSMTGAATNAHVQPADRQSSVAQTCRMVALDVAVDRRAAEDHFVHRYFRIVVPARPARRAGHTEHHLRAFVGSSSMKATGFMLQCGFARISRTSAGRTPRRRRRARGYSACCGGATRLMLRNEGAVGDNRDRQQHRVDDEDAAREPLEA